jgi:uncharacterized protein involved in type VI secretion and phage assembly
VSNGRVFYGKYRGVVTDNQDPLMIGRVRAQVPDVMGTDESGWAMPCAPFGGNQTGFFALPSIGAGVWVEFEHGDPEWPIWAGCWWGSVAEMPPVLVRAPYAMVVLQTEGGHNIVLDDTPGAGGVTLVTSGGQKIALSMQGIEISNGQGASIKLKGPKLTLNDGALEAT